MFRHATEEPIEDVPTQEEILYDVGSVLAIVLVFAALISMAFAVGSAG